MSKGIPKKPEYGPCRESHGMGVGISPTGTSYLYNGAGTSTGYYWMNPTTANDSTSATYTLSNWTIV